MRDKRTLDQFLSTLSLRRATSRASQLRWLSEFLSTLSLRRATFIFYVSRCFLSYFYPRSPCGERLATSAAVASPKNFYPRSPCGERLASSYGHFRDLQISIHALLAESDHPCGRLYPVQLHISIHALLAESDQNATYR